MGRIVVVLVQPILMGLLDPQITVLGPTESVCTLSNYLVPLGPRCTSYLGRDLL